MSHALMLSVAVALMLTGALMLVTGSSSVVWFAAIAIGIALTVIDRREHHAAH